MNGFRDELHQRLQIIAVMIFGSANILPVWKDETVKGLSPPSMVDRDRTFNVTKTFDFQSCITRKEIALAIHEFVGKSVKYANVCLKCCGCC